MEIRRPRWAALGAGAALVGLIVAVAVLSGSEDRPRSKPSATQEAGASVGRPRVQWENPFRDGVRVASVSAAARRLAFDPVLPRSAGSPRAVYVHRDVRRPEQQALGLVYQSARYGRFLTLEEPTQQTQAALDTLAGCPAGATCEGTWKTIRVSDGGHGLLVAGPASNGVIWIRDGVQFDVFGPTRTFSVAEAKRLANEIASAAS